MNENILSEAVQIYLETHLHADTNKTALAKSPFELISATELAGQLAAKKKAIPKIPTWGNTRGIYYPPLLSMEQCSSEATAIYKSSLAIGKMLVDLTAGFGVDSYFFSKRIAKVYSCEINPELSAIAAHNASILNATGIECLSGNGINFIETIDTSIDTIYIDPARRREGSKVFRLKDCTPDVVSNLALFLRKADRIIIKTAPLLDITAGLIELTHVREIHIVSVKNDCKELLWVIDKNFNSTPQIICATLNQTVKTFSFFTNEVNGITDFHEGKLEGYLYEPDVAMLKSGAFNLIGKRFQLKKLHQQSQLYVSSFLKHEFLGRIFEITTVLSLNELKKAKDLIGSVIVRNFPDTPENLIKKFKILPHREEFIIFTTTIQGYVAIKAKILQHY